MRVKISPGSRRRVSPRTRRRRRRLKHHVEKILPYTPDQLFALVGDVEAYPQFVPWIRSLRTWNARQESEGVSLLDAQASVGFAMLKESFSTRVRRDVDARVIDVALLSGPFRHLTNRWSFTAVEGGTRIAFDIDFEFKSRLLAGLLAANFGHAVDRLMGCFQDRAKALYG